NIIVGLIVGVGVHGVAFSEAFHSYTVLTIGDGLVSQIPALIVSTAAGLLVTKGGVAGRTDEALIGQLTNYPKALAVVSGLLAYIALLPGLPFVPFALLSAITGYSAWKLMKSQKAAVVAAEQEKAAEEMAKATPAEEPITAALAMDQIRLELGYGLLSLVNDNSSGVRLTDQIKALRRQLATDYGFIMPSVRILDNTALQPITYAVFVKETEVGRGDLRPEMLLVMHPSGERVDLPGEDTREPAFGLPALWVDKGLRDEANFRGYRSEEHTSELQSRENLVCR